MLHSFVYMMVHSKTSSVQPRRNAFTIVELLIVIVVIGILVGITIVGYTGVIRTKWNADRAVELQAWQSLFYAYKAEHGAYPTPTDNVFTPSASGCGPAGEACRYYCLGKNFIQNVCWNPYDRIVKGDMNQPMMYADFGILNALESIRALPDGPRWGASSSAPTTELTDGVGPLVKYRNGQAYSVLNFFHNRCPQGMDTLWSDSNASTCEIKLQ